MLNFRKDVAPEITIKTIKNILKVNGIKVKEKKVRSINNNFFSVRIEVKGFYDMGTNGKGLTQNLARASAYAELMERIQSRILINNYFLNKNNNLFCFHTECVNDDLLYKSKCISSFFYTNNYEKLFIDNDKYKVLDKYKDLINNRYCYLPTKLIYLTSSSNGLCAGNNYYEAISQGIAEIFERYIYRKILFEDIELDEITIDEKLPIYKKIRSLENDGYKIIIKDCTNDTLPVIGVLIIKNNKYLFTLGSDCDINIAIQRCLTEALQGLDSTEQIEKKMKPIDNNYSSFSNNDKFANWLRCYSSNDGIHPQTIFDCSNKKDYKSLKIFKNLSSNTEVFDYLLRIIKNLHLSVYIKDYSYLGFNTYKIFIPNLSNISYIDEDDILIYKNYDEIKNIYFDLETFYDKDTLIRIIKVLKNVMNHDKYSFITLGNFFHTERYLKTNYNNITFSFFVGLLELKVYNKVISTSEISDSKIKNYFEKINFLNIPDRFSYVIKDLDLKLPSCPNCSKCNLNKKCKYKNWKKINEHLKKQEAFFK